MKLPVRQLCEERRRSLSSRRAWIEIAKSSAGSTCGIGRSPRGGRGLKSMPWSTQPHKSRGRSPRGGRGLKSSTKVNGDFEIESLSSRRAWIEIRFRVLSPAGRRQSLSSRRAWIEIKTRATMKTSWPRSLSSRRAWIEIPMKCLKLSHRIRRSPRGGRGLKSGRE